MDHKTIYEYFSEYTHSEINLVLRHIPEKYQKILYLKYHRIKDSIYAKELSFEDEKNFKEFLDYFEIKLEKRYQRKIKTIYQYFPDYKEEEINMVISTLGHKSKSILHLKYGNDLKNPLVNFVLEEKDAEYFYTNILKYIKKRLSNQEQLRKTIYDYFPENTIEEIDLVIENLNDRSKLLLKKKYGDDLKNPKIFTKLEGNDANYFSSSLLVTMKRYLTNKKNLWYKKTIYEYFPEYSKEEIDIVLDSLPIEVLEILKIKYVDDIKKPTKIKKLNKDDYQLFYNIGLLTIKRRLKNRHKKVKTIYEYFLDYSRLEVDKTIKLLPEKAKLILILKYGYNFNNPIKESFLTEKQKRYFSCDLLPCIRKRLHENRMNNQEDLKNNLNYEDYKELINVLKQFLLNKLLTIFTYQESIVIILKLVLNYDTEVISNLLNISDLEILNISKKFLTLYKDEMIKNINLENKIR